MGDFRAFAVAVAYSAGAIICHQLPERSFFWDERQLPVCARCTGLYLGVAIGLAAWFVIRRLQMVERIAQPRQVVGALLIAAAPTALSWATGVSGVWDGTNVIRASLALPLGVTVGAIVAAVAAKDLR